MKTSLIVRLLGLLVVALLSSCIFTSCQATGFGRTVPVSRQGGWSEFRFRVLEAPPEWSQDINPLLAPGDYENYDDPSERAKLTARLHRGNMRLITQDRARHIQEDMAEDWAAEMEWRAERLSSLPMNPN